MNFLKEVLNSIHSPRFYSTLPQKSFKQSLGYFLLLILILTIIKVISLIQPLFVEVPMYLQKFGQGIIDCYPADLELKITNGQASVNTPEPYFLTCPGLDPNQKLVVVDTKTPYSLAKFEEYGAPVWITKDSLVYQKNQYETRSYNLNQVQNFKLNKQVLSSYYNLLTPYLKFVGPILLLLSLIGILLIYNFRLIYLLLLAAVILVLSRLFKKGLSFGQSYKVGLHAITLGLILELLVGLTTRFTNFSGFPFMVTVLTLSVVTVNLFLPKREN